MGIDYDRYLKVCRDAATNEAFFHGFKSNPDYNWVLEHVSYQQGLEYLEEIKKDNPQLLNFMRIFGENDNIGNPQMFWYKDINMNMSPTTLRYIKVLSDLLKYFGTLEDFNIVEIGGGYGGQCSIISKYCDIKSYTLVDLPDVLSLAGKFMKAQARDVILRSPENTTSVSYDLCISNYAFAEIERTYQDFYVEHLIKKSANGYITCNFMSNTTDGRLSKEELLNLQSNCKIVEEIPHTASDNFIYLWIG